MACILIAAKLDHAGTNEKNIYQSASEDISPQEIVKMEFEILKELEFDLR